MAHSGSPRSLGDFLRTGYLVHDVSRLRRQFYDQQSRHLGITRAQWWVLFNLARHDGEPLHQNKLAQLLELGSASVGELIRRLEKAGFVKRVSDPRDRRRKRVTVAKRGFEVLEHMRLVARDNNALIMAGFSAEDQEQLNELLGRMKRNLTWLVLTADRVEIEPPDTADAVAKSSIAAAKALASLTKKNRMPPSNRAPALGGI